jgi:methylated-DNA-protein-cysteine methyltransferase-like protein
MVMATCHDPSIPWHRVVRADGSLAKGATQRRLLEAEGVPFRGERVDMRLARVGVEALTQG